VGNRRAFSNPLEALPCKQFLYASIGGAMLGTNKLESCVSQGFLLGQKPFLISVDDLYGPMGCLSFDQTFPVSKFIE